MNIAESNIAGILHALRVIVEVSAALVVIVQGALASLKKLMLVGHYMARLDTLQQQVYKDVRDHAERLACVETKIEGLENVSRSHALRLSSKRRVGDEKNRRRKCK